MSIMLPSGISVRIREDLLSGAARTQTTLVVDPLVTITGHRITMTDIGDKGYGKLEQGTVREELMSWTGITDNGSTMTLTGCEWGINLHNLTAGVNENKKRHTVGSSFKITTDMHFVAEQYRDKDNNLFESPNDFEIKANEIKLGDGTDDNDKVITAANGDANEPFMAYDEGLGKWVISNDGVNSYDPEQGGSGVTAGDGIDITGGVVSVDADQLVDDQALEVVGNRVKTVVDTTTGLNKSASGIGIDVIDPDNIIPQAAGYLTGGTGHSALAVFQSLFSGANNGKIKINVDKQEYDNVAVSMQSQLLSSLAYVKNELLGEPVRFSPDGTKLFCNPTQSYGYYSPIVSTLTTPFDISTATIWKYKDFSSNNYPTSFFISPDGTMLFWAARPGSSGTMYLYKTTLSTPWDVTTNGAITNVTLYSTGTGFSRLYFSDNGLYLFMPYFTSGTPSIYRFRLTTAWDIATLNTTPDTYLMPTAFNNDSFCLHLNSDGTQISFLNENRVAKRYNLAEAFTPSFTNLQSEATLPTGSYGSKYGLLMLNEKLITSGANNNFYTEEYAFGAVQSLAEVAGNLQTGIRLATSGLETAEYDTDHFKITSATKNRKSQVLKLMTPSTGTDISGAGAIPYLDMADNATETLGTGEEYRIVRLDSNGLINKNLAPSQKIDINSSIFSIIASETLKTSADTERSTTGTTYIKLKEIVFNAFYSGIIRVKFNLEGQSSSLAYGRIYINGVAIGVERSINNTGALYTEDISVNKGDLVQLYIKSQVNGSPARCWNFRLYYDLVNVGAGTNVVAIN